MDIKEIGFKDRSEFLRGFSVVMRKNNLNSNDEKIMFSIIGNFFGFNGDFCKESLENLMENKHISEEPSVFSNERLADFFIKDITKMFVHTNAISHSAIEWLQKTAKVNNVDFVL